MPDARDPSGLPSLAPFWPEKPQLGSPEATGLLQPRGGVNLPRCLPENKGEVTACSWSQPRQEGKKTSSGERGGLLAFKKCSGCKRVRKGRPSLCVNTAQVCGSRERALMLRSSFAFHVVTSCSWPQPQERAGSAGGEAWVQPLQTPGSNTAWVGTARA